MASGEGTDPPTVFINYRSKDTGATASGLYRDLTESIEFGLIFIDHEEIEGGENWRDRLVEGAGGAKVLISLIGERWLTLQDPRSGRRLLDQPKDWVRREIELAIESDVDLLPVLVGEARPLERDDLYPHEKIRGLADIHALRLRRKDWPADLAKLQEWLEKKGFRRRRPDPGEPGSDPVTSEAARGLGQEIASYLEKAGAFHATHQLAGFETRLRVPIRLEDLFVPLNAHCDIRGVGRAEFGDGEEAAKALSREETHREVPLSEVFLREGPWSRSRGLVILGDPGSGKTTHLKRLLLWLAKEGPESLGLPRDMAPVFLPLRNLGDLERGLDAFIQEELAEPHLGTAPGFGRRLLDRGNLLILLDGLDEVASLDARTAVSGWINDAAKVLESCRFVVTCRYAGYRSEVRLSERFFELHLRPLGRSQAEEFIRRWFEIVETSLAEDQEQARVTAHKSADELIGKLREPAFRARRVFELTRNPLLLTAICLVHRDRGRLPHRRAELYDECVNVLLEKWREAKKLEVNFHASDARRVLQPVAFWLHGEDERTTATAEELSPVLETGLAGVKRDDVSPRAFLQTIRDESGLLTGWSGDTFGFMHLGFQEYLAAREIRSRAFVDPSVLDELARRFGESWWREVGLLLLALEEPSLFEPYMRQVLEQPGLVDHPDLMEECLDDAVQVSAAPFVELLRLKPKKKRALWARQLVALRALERIAPAELEALAEILRRHPSPEISGRFREREGLETILAPRGGHELVLVPGGKFVMGSPESEEGRFSAEGPAHEVTVPGFYLGRRPVTNEEYGRFMEAEAEGEVPEPEYWGDRRFNQPRQPVVGVSWDDAQRYCRWAGLRLPGEAEWEYACRAGTRTRFWSGDTEEDLARVGWYGENSDGRLHTVGEKPANPLGLHDVHGNVWEWCEDTWHDSYKGAPEDGSAWTTGGAPFRVGRGGSWNYTARFCRSADRVRGGPGVRDSHLGFRPASWP